MKEAYEIRKQEADSFIELMQEAFAAKGREPSFTREDVEAFLVMSSKRYATAEDLEKVSIDYVMPASGAIKQWPGYRDEAVRESHRSKRFP